MARIVMNPAGVDAEYLRCLKVCFPGAWNEESYHWYLKRPFRSRPPDVVAVRDGGALAAGMGINYRQLALPDGRIVDVAIYTAAWALPEHRGRWHFARLIRASNDVARERGCVAAMSFVTADNASAAVLRRAGARPVPTTYLSTAPGSPLSCSARLPALTRCASMPDAGHATVGDFVEFAYRNTADWRSQMLERPNRTSAWLADGRLVVLDHTATTDRLQFVSGNGDHGSIVAAFGLRAQRMNRAFFHVTTRDGVADAARSCGMAVQPGHIMIIGLLGDANEDAGACTLPTLMDTPWCVQAGDRM